MRMLWLSLLLAAAAPGADLPVREIVLYKHGVGYFVRSGQIAPNEPARLEFKAAEMNDVLKSLTVGQQGGGRVAGLRYDSSEPLERKLSEFPFHVEQSQPLGGILDQFKGARVELRFPSETASGAIVSAHFIPASEKSREREQISLLLDSGDLRNFDLEAASGIRFADPKLQTQFRTYLGILAESRGKEKRSIYIDSAGASARSVTAAYMIPMPVWKSTYRLIFESAGEPVFEGWAIVDNTTGEDWTNIRLSLVSGRPVSFISRLYEPQYVTRPGAELPEERAQAPVVYEGALDAQQKVAAGTGGYKGVVGGVPGGLAGGVIGGIIGAAPSAAPPPPPPRADVIARLGASSVVVPAAARELGEMFEYRITAPVTVRQNESAMLPFLQQKLDTRKLLIYSDRSSTHPMNAAEIVNSTGKTLDGGPITVYDGGAYAGEALMETLKSGDKRLISYAVDLGTRITTAFETRGDMIREVHARRGVLTTRTSALETTTYTIRNVDQKARTLLIEHPVRPEYTLVGIKPLEKTSRAYRFEVKLAPDSADKFPVSEERVYESSLSLVNLTPDVLLTYVRNKTLSDPARKQLEEVLDRKRQIAAAEAEISRAEADINNLTADQDRIRRNIESLNQVNGQQQQVQAYARQLASQEARLAGLRDGLAETQRKRAALESELNQAIEALSF